MAMQKWKIEVTLAVEDSWVADGFDATKEIMEERLKELLPYAYSFEFKVRAKVIEAPPKQKIKELQGYVPKKLKS
jgi:hypothetical protein